MGRWLTVLLCFAALGCDLASGLGDLRFDLPGAGGAGGTGGSGRTTGGGGGLNAGTVTFGDRSDADVPDVAKDAHIASATPDLNFGVTDLLNMSNEDNGEEVALLRFDLSAVDPTAQVMAARVELVTGTCAECSSGGVFTAYPLLEDWATGIQNGDNGAASWTLARIDTPWTTPGAGPGSHDDTAPLDSIDNPDGTVTLELDLSVVQAWVDGSRENHGMAILAENGSGDWRVDSSNANDESRRPLLTLELAP